MNSVRNSGNYLVIFFFTGISIFSVGDEEYPTLLHFAARCGLKNLTWALLECVGAVQAIYVRNCNGLTALELAEENGHNGVINCLQSFIQILVWFYIFQK
jgi:ankyrin repeat protein